MKRFLHKGGKFKYHFSVQVRSVSLRDGIALLPDVRYRVLWKKGDRAASTREVAASSVGVASYDEELSLVCTMYRDPDRGAAQYLPKEATFTLLCGREGKKTGSFRPLGRAKVDLARHASLEAMTEELMLVLLHDGVPVGDLVLTLSSRWLRNYDKHGSSGKPLASSDSGSDSGRSDSLSSIGSEAESSGWPTADDDTDADLSDVGSEAGESFPRASAGRRGGGGASRAAHQVAGGASDVEDDRDLDTEEELEAMIEEQQRGKRGAGRVLGALMPRLRVGGSDPASKKGSDPKKGSEPKKGIDPKMEAAATATALVAAEARTVVLEKELASMQEANFEASRRADRLEYERRACIAELGLLELEVELKAKHTASAEAEAAAALAEAAAARAAVARAMREAEQAKDALEATREALSCLEASAAASATANADEKTDLAAAIAAQSRAETTIKPAQEMAAAAIARREEELAARERAEQALSTARAELGRLSAEHAALADRLQLQRGQLATLVAAEQEASARASHYLERCAYELASHAAATAEHGQSRVHSLLEHAAAHARLAQLAARDGSVDGRGGGIGGSAASQLADQLIAEGKAANEVGDAARARGAYEAAFMVHPRVSLLLSTANMYLKSGAPQVAAHAYRAVLGAALVSAHPVDVSDGGEAGGAACGVAGGAASKAAGGAHASAHHGAEGSAAGGAASVRVPVAISAGTGAGGIYGLSQLFGRPTEREVAMAHRKLTEAEAMVAVEAAEAARIPAGRLQADRAPCWADRAPGSGADVGEASAASSVASVLSSAKPGSTHGSDAEQDAEMALLSAKADFVRCRQQRDALQDEIKQLKSDAAAFRAKSARAEGSGAQGVDAAVGSSGVAADRLSADPLRSTLHALAQVEALTAELRRAKMEAAQALAEKVALGHELVEQHRLQRKAKVQRVAELEKMTALEVKLAKARETRHGVRDAAPWVRSATGGRVLGRGPGTIDAEDEGQMRMMLQAQSEQILQLVNEKEELQAKLSAAEAKLI